MSQEVCPGGTAVEHDDLGSCFGQESRGSFGHFAGAYEGSFAAFEIPEDLFGQIDRDARHRDLAGADRGFMADAFAYANRSQHDFAEGLSQRFRLACGDDGVFELPENLRFTYDE